MTRVAFSIVAYGAFMLSTCSSPAAALVPATSGQEVAPTRAADWLTEAAKRVTPEESTLLRRSQATLLGNIVLGDAWKPYRGVMPSVGTYRGVWNWDSAFHAVAISHWDSELAREQFKILFSKQLPNGALPDVIYENGTWLQALPSRP